jgi:hypothetical protein
MTAMRPRFRPLALALPLASACQSPQADSSAFVTSRPATSGEGTASTSGSTGESSSGASADASSTTGELSTTSTGVDDSETTLILDVGSDMDLGDGQPVGCKGKIDFLFVISRAPGMEWFQAPLLDAFPKFIDTIEAKFADFDYHIMVVDADAEWGVEVCQEACPNPGESEGCSLADYPCDHTPTECDLTMGAGVVFPAADDASNKLCPIDDGRRYMIKGQTQLKETFACVAQVGSSGYDKLGEAMSAAVQSWMNDDGACNDGFLRDDALLMITLIANTYDGGLTGSQWGDPMMWAEEVRKAKHGDLDSVVLLNIGDTMVPGCHDHDRLCQMVKLFPYALNTEVWADDYGPFFDEATELVSQACAEFTPPG